YLSIRLGTDMPNRRTAGRVAARWSYAISRTIVPAVAAIMLPKYSARAGNIWDGGGSNNNWSTGANWNFDNQPPANNGSITVVMGGTTRLMSNVNDPYDIFGLLFNIDATSGFTLDGDDLTIRDSGISQFSAVPQTVNNQ